MPVCVSPEHVYEDSPSCDELQKQDWIREERHVPVCVSLERVTEDFLHELSCSRRRTAVRGRSSLELSACEIFFHAHGTWTMEAILKYHA